MVARTKASNRSKRSSRAQKQSFSYSDDESSYGSRSGRDTYSRSKATSWDYSEGRSRRGNRGDDDYSRADDDYSRDDYTRDSRSRRGYRRGESDFTKGESEYTRGTLDDDSLSYTYTARDDDSEYSSGHTRAGSIASDTVHDEFSKRQTPAPKKSEMTMMQFIWSKITGSEPAATSDAGPPTDLVCGSGGVGAAEDDNSISVCSEIPEETIQERIIDTIPICKTDVIMDPDTPGKSNEIHQLINKQKWSAIRRRLKLLTELSGDVPREVKYREKLEVMVQEADEFGRSPLSLACGKSSAPLDVITSIIQSFPQCVSMRDKNENLPIHHFCHSYQLDDEIVDPDELGVLKRLVQQYPDGIRAVNAYGNTPLHIYLEHRVISGMREGTADVVEELVKMNRSAASVKNKGGSLPMHHIGKSPLQTAQINEEKKREYPNAADDFRAIFQHVHRVNPKAVQTKNKLGATPFFVSVIYDAELEVWKSMLLKYPKAAVVDNGRGVAPIAAFWNMFVSVKAKTKYLNLTEADVEKETEKIENNRKEMAKIKSLKDLQVNAPPYVRDFWDKMELMLRAAAHGSVALRLPKEAKWRAIHAICSTRDCPSDGLKFALQMYAFQAEEPNENKDTPLHLVAGQGKDFLPTKRQSENMRAMLKRLLYVFPSGAGDFNSQGRVALHIALASGVTWSYGIEDLLVANRGAAAMSDPISGLFPFMMAACAQPKEKNGIGVPENEKAERKIQRLTTVYNLLRLAPMLVSPKSVQDAIDIKMQTKNYELMKEKKNLTKHVRDMEKETTTLKANLENQERTVAALQEELDELKNKMSTAEKDQGKLIMKFIKEEVEDVHVEDEEAEEEPVQVERVKETAKKSKKKKMLKKMKR